MQKKTTRISRCTGNDLDGCHASIIESQSADHSPEKPTCGSPPSHHLDPANASASSLYTSIVLPRRTFSQASLNTGASSSDLKTKVLNWKMYRKGSFVNA